jgi:translation initiation factor IF-3
MVGVVDVRDAIDKAKEAGLDLVEVSPESDPPVCRILDFGKYRYEQSKKEKANRARSKAAETKEVRLGRSMKIDPHDIAIRLQQARKFLMDGHKVQIVQNFRGREMLHRERGRERMNHVIKTLEDIAKVEMDPRMAGRRMSILLSPDRNKIGRLQQAAKAEAKQAAPEAAPEAAAAPPQPAPEPQTETPDQES